MVTFSLNTAEAKEIKTLQEPTGEEAESESVCGIMAGPAAAVAEAWDKVNVFVHSQLYDERNWAKNMEIAKALGLFDGSIVFMHTCGDIMAI